MAKEDNSISYRIYFVAFAIFLFAILIVFKLTNIQWGHGEYYRKLAKKHDVKRDIVPANRGNIYSSDGSLLAVSVPIYIVRFDALAPTEKVFDKNINALSDSLGILFGKPSNFFETKLRLARRNNNRFLLLAKDIGYSQYARLKSFPILKLGNFEGGRMDSIREVRKHPIGEIAQRTVGYIGIDKNGNKI